MPSRKLQYFMQSSECLEIVQSASKQFNLQTWLIGAGIQKRIEFASSEPSLLLSNNAPVYWIALSKTKIEHELIFSGPLIPAAWGWVLVEVPRSTETTLYMGQMSAKSDWLDPQTGELHYDNTSIELFDRIKPVFRRRLKHPILIQDIKTGNTSPCKGVWYSLGAIECFSKGQHLKQEGVEYTTFTVKP